MQRATVPPSKSPFKSQKRRKARRQRKSKVNQSKQERFMQLSAPPPSTTFRNSPFNIPIPEIWRKTYENLVKWQVQHQTQYWRNTTNQLRRENAELKKRLQTIKTSSDRSDASQKSLTHTEESESEDEDGDDGSSVDEKYLEFMTKTRQHQMTVQDMKENVKRDEDSYKSD